MRLRMWMLDVAREQCPTLDHLRVFCRTTLESGYDAIGLYLEHRFAYPSTPWAHGTGCVTPEMVSELQREFTALQIIPFVNLLGHCEGMLYTEHGARYAEEPMKGLQACPSNPEFAALASGMLDDVLRAFNSEIIHIGGDETAQLGKCPVCKARIEASQASDPKAEVYGAHFGPLAQHVVNVGRRPAAWADMFLEHPSALASIPTSTLLFDWHYNESCEPTTRDLMGRGFDVVCCPTLHIYNALWCHLPESERNIRQALADCAATDAFGFCLTTWECGLFGAYDSVLPMVRAAGRWGLGALPDGPAPSAPGEGLLASYADESLEFGEWARLMGVSLQECGEPFEFSGIRSSLKCRLLLYGNPFLAWFHHWEQLCGPSGDAALQLLDRALAVAPNEAAKGVTLFARAAVEFVRIAEAGRRAYAEGKPSEAIGKLASTRQIFDDLAVVAKRTHVRIGGSLADVERCRTARGHVEEVIRRIRQYGDGSLGYLPAFEVLTSHHFMPHDQGGWWIVNRWARE